MGFECKPMRLEKNADTFLNAEVLEIDSCDGSGFDINAPASSQCSSTFLSSSSFSSFSSFSSSSSSVSLKSAISKQYRNLNLV